MKLHYNLLHWLPRQCHLCRLSITGSTPNTNRVESLFWCQDCIKRLNQSPSRCQRCGLHTPTPVAQCGQCLAHPSAWDRLYCLNDYQAPLKEYIQQLKYQRKFWLACDLALLLSECIKMPAPELIPVPLHWRRMWQRGFNQSAEIADYLAKHLRQQGYECQINDRVFKRTQATPQQKGLTKAQRMRNTLRAFQLIQPPVSKHVALVDDVVTTGSTLKPLCRLLRKSGGERIDVYCLSRTSEPK